MAGLSGRVDSGGNSQFNWRNHILLGRQMDIQILGEKNQNGYVGGKLIADSLFKKGR